MTDEDRANAELAALVYADVKASGATTVGEVQAAVAASLQSLMSDVRVEVVEPTPEQKAQRLVSVRVLGPRLPG